MPRLRSIAWLFVAVLMMMSGAVRAADWPTYQHDNARSGVTTEQLKLPLTETWVYQSRHAPRPAWPPPAKQDFWHNLRGLRPLVTYDRAFHPVVEGGTLYFGSSADDKVYALDAATGKERWTFFTEGPVRLAPAVHDDRVYVGSDDGRVYVLSATKGKLLWTHAPDSYDHRIPGNGRMISARPLRTGVLVDGDTAYYCAGVFPSQDVYRSALRARDGKVLWQNKTSAISPQGYLLASPTRLFVPSGRTTPALFSREDGKPLGVLQGQGGAYALLADETMVSGPGRTSGQLDLTETDSKESIATFDGLRMIVNQGVAYLHSKESLSALDRTRYIQLAKERNVQRKRFNRLKDRIEKLGKGKNAERGQLRTEMREAERSIAGLTKSMQECFLWKHDCNYPYSLILAGDVLFAGGDNKVAALSASDGSEVWAGDVTGNAYGLCAANGALFVSTDQGAIHCFRPGRVEREYVVRPGTDPAPYPEDDLTQLYERAAKQIIDTAYPLGEDEPVKKGYCLVLSCGEGRLAYELAKRTDLQIVGVEEDAKKVAAARAALDKTGLYGVRVTVHHGSLDDLPYTSYFANVVACDQTVASGKLPPSSAEVCRVLRPYGGMACIGRPEDDGGRSPKLRESTLKQWLDKAPVSDSELVEENGLWGVIRRGSVPGGGEWTQLYANPAHTACSKDELRGPTEVQWFGEPGPRRIIDRHHRPMSPLFKNGRVFVPANDRIIALDAYNGTGLWDLHVPNSRRVGIIKNCGYMLAVDDYVYIAVEDECWAVDVANGAHMLTLNLPQLSDDPHDWGYLDQVGDQLFGSGQKQGASFKNLSKATVNMIEGDFRPVIVSDYLFSVDRHTGKKLWTYRNGTIMNNAIAVYDGRMYFIESRNKKTFDDDDGRVGVHVFCKSDTYLVALDISTGKKVYETPFEFPFQHIMFLNVAENTLLATGSYNRDDRIYYGLFAFHADTGAPKWENNYLGTDIRGHNPGPIGGSHGEQWQHPVIVGTTIYSRPYSFDLLTGKRGEYVAYRGGHGCGGLTGSAHYLYGRGDNPRMYPLDVDKTSGIKLTHITRPGCWLNIIAVGGVIVIPESSSGCTCSYPMQTSIAFVPRALSGSEPL